MFGRSQVKEMRAFILNVMALAVGSHALASASARDEGVDFKRVRKIGVAVEYRMRMEIVSLGMTITARVSDSLVKVGADGKAVIRFQTIDQQVTNGDPPPLPGDLVSKVSANNMPDDIRLTVGQLDYYYLLLGAAGVTADRKVSVGDSFPLKWRSSQQGIEFEGTGKVLEIAEKTIKVLIKIKVLLPGFPWTPMTITSVYDIADGSLKSSVNNWDVPGDVYRVTINRLAAKDSPV